MKTRMERLTAKRDRLQNLLAQCEQQIKDEQYKENLEHGRLEYEYWRNDKTKVFVEATYDNAKVYASNISVGNFVKKGDVLFVLEALKMEIPILAPQNGKITQINASVGTRVSKGDVLAVVDTW